MARGADGLEVGPHVGEVGRNGQGNDVVDLLRGLGEALPCTRTAHGLVTQDARTHGLPAHGAVDASYDRVAAGAVVLGVAMAAATEDPSERARLRRHGASGRARWDERAPSIA